MEKGIQGYLWPLKRDKSRRHKMNFICLDHIVLEVPPLSMTTLRVSFPLTLPIEMFSLPKISILVRSHSWFRPCKNLKILPLSTTLTCGAAFVFFIFICWYWSSFIHSPFKVSWCFHRENLVWCETNRFLSMKPI